MQHLLNAVICFVFVVPKTIEYIFFTAPVVFVQNVIGEDMYGFVSGLVSSISVVALVVFGNVSIIDGSETVCIRIFQSSFWWFSGILVCREATDLQATLGFEPPVTRSFKSPRSAVVLGLCIGLAQAPSPATYQGAQWVLFSIVPFIAGAISALIQLPMAGERSEGHSVLEDSI